MTTIQQHAENFRYSLTEEGEFEAYEYLLTQVDESDRREVKSRADYLIYMEDALIRHERERIATKAAELGCSVELTQHIERMERRIEELANVPRAA